MADPATSRASPSESSPLLGEAQRPSTDQSDGTQEGGTQQVASGEDAIAQRDRRFFRALLALTTLSLSLSTITMLFPVILFTLVSYTRPSSFYAGYDWEEALKSTGLVSLVCFLVSLPNFLFLRRRGIIFLPLWMLFFIDFFLALFATSIPSGGLSDLFYGRMFNCYGAHGSCEAYATTIKIPTALLFSLAIVLGLVHVALWVMRGIAGYRSRFVQENGWQSPWNFPHGQVTFAFTVKFLREPERDVESNGGAPAGETSAPRI